jgi:hypothetical protein
MVVHAQHQTETPRASINMFPDSSFISPFTADAHAHRTEVENILFSKDIRASMGTMIPVANILLFNTEMQASLGASVHFELHPVGQAQIVSNDYYIDFLTLDIPLQHHLFARWVIGHTSHHFSDNWYERLKLSSSMRYSRDYVKVFAVYESDRNIQFYLGADYAYTFTIGRRIERPWIFQVGGIIPVAEFGRNVLFAAGDSKLHQETSFAATNTAQIGMMFPMQPGKVLRISVQYRSGLDERGQFFPQHRSFTALALSFE